MPKFRKAARATIQALKDTIIASPGSQRKYVKKAAKTKLGKILASDVKNAMKETRADLFQEGAPEGRKLSRLLAPVRADSKKFHKTHLNKHANLLRNVDRLKLATGAAEVAGAGVAVNKLRKRRKKQ